MSDTLLKVDQLNAWYGRAQVLFDLGLEVGRGRTMH
jgi:branched-chain amino acid transport system ATP-binding protein